MTYHDLRKLNVLLGPPIDITVCQVCGVELDAEERIAYVENGIVRGAKHRHDCLARYKKRMDVTNPNVLHRWEKAIA